MDLRLEVVRLGFVIGLIVGYLLLLFTCGVLSCVLSFEFAFVIWVVVLLAC